MQTKDFNPETMTRATAEDIDRMFSRLWGWAPLIESLARNNPEMEYLDLTQEDAMQYRLTATNDRKTVSVVYFTSTAAEIARKVYEDSGYTVTVTEE